MIKGTKNIKDSDEYFATPLDSASSLKIFSQDRKKYNRLFIENNKTEKDEEDEKDTKSTIVGKLVECILWEPDLFDKKFHLSACANSPTGLMESFVESLYDYTKEATNEEGNIIRSFEDISRDAFNKSGFSGKASGSYENVIKRFIGSDNEIYYNEIRTVRANNLTVVTVNDVTNAEKIVEELKTNPITKDIVGLVDSKRYTIKKQYQIEGFKIDGHIMKAMMDLVVIDHFKQSIFVYDLKTTWSVENFFSEYYLYRLAFLQAFVYYAAAVYMTKTIEEYKDYKVLPPQFIVCDSTNYYSPLIYTLTEKDLEEAYDGFEYRGKKYNGVKTIIADLKWALQENCWNISRENYLSNGIVKLK
jgi:hypothetical protein